MTGRSPSGVTRYCLLDMGYKSLLFEYFGGFTHSFQLSNHQHFQSLESSMLTIRLFFVLLPSEFAGCAGAVSDFAVAMYCSAVHCPLWQFLARAGIVFLIPINLCFFPILFSCVFS